MKVLIHCGDLLENQHRILPLAESLRNMGADPFILHYKPSVGAFFEARGLKVLHLDAYRSRIKKRDVRKGAIADAFWDDEAYSIYKVKHEFLRALAVDRHRELYMLRRDGLALTRLFDEHQFDSIIIWNGVTGHVANAMRILAGGSGITGGFLERGYLPNSVFFDRIGTNGASSLARGSDVVYSPEDASTSTEACLDFVRSVLLKSTAPPICGRKQIFVPLQVQQDSNILLYSPKVKTMRQLVLRAVSLAHALGPDWDVVVRDHPEEMQAPLNIPFSDRVWRDNSSTLEERINSSQVVFTVNSTVGLTAALAGKVIVCIGDGIYCRESFVINAATMTLDELVERVFAAYQNGPNTEALMRFMCLLVDRHQVFDAGQVLDRSYRTRALSQVSARESARGTSGTKEISLLECIRQKLKAVHERYPEGISVRFELDPADTLSLTYRKSAERVTVRWIMQALERNFPDVTFRVASPEVPHYIPAVCVCSGERERFSKEHCEYIAVFDQYGEPHLRFYN